jgi:hypothetical protein
MGTIFVITIVDVFRIIKLVQQHLHVCVMIVITGIDVNFRHTVSFCHSILFLNISNI